ncbi:MAG: hypothetical protein RLY21_1874 [Planctomycetota bacterium]|jgi:hypothetical protein
MSMNSASTALATRLTRHFAAGAAVAAAVSFTATADVVYTPVNWTIPANIDGLYINVETLATGSSAATTPGWDINPYSATALTWFNATGTGMLRFPGVTTGSAGNLPAGTIVGSTGSYGSGTVTVGSAAGNWQLNAVNLFGFRFIAASGQTHYGWGRMVVGSAITQRTITGIAWENIPTTPIAVGNEGGPPPNYDPCASFNPTLSVSSSSVALNQDTAANLDLGGSSCAFTVRKANFFKFTPPATGSYIISTCPSAVDTRMAVVTDCANPAGTLLACNDDSGCGNSASITLSLTQDSPVYVVIGGAGKADLPSPLPVSITPPPVQACVNAIVATYGDNPISNTGITEDPRAYTNATQTTSAEVWNAQWFAFTPTATGQFVIKACQAGDTRLAIGTSCPLVGGILGTIAYSDDAPTCLTSSTATTSFGSWIDATNNGATGAYAGFPLTQDLVAGTTYYIAVGGFANTDVVSGVLNISGPEAPNNPADLDGDGVVGPQDLAILLGNWDGTGVGDIDADGVVGASDLGALLNSWTS